MSGDDINAFLKKSEPSLFRGRGDEPGKRLGEIAEAAPLKDIAGYDCAIIGLPEYEGIVRNGGRISKEKEYELTVELNELVLWGGPYSVRKRLYTMTPGGFGRKVAEKLKIADLGDIVFPTHKIDKALERLAQVVEYVHEQNVIPIVIGGGHHISIGSIGGIARSDADKTLGITVVDAHCDFRESEDGKIHSGIPFRYLRDKYPSISGKAFVEFGLRPERNAEKYIREMEEWGASLYHLDEETPPSPEELLKTNGYAENIFLSIDIDAFDIRGASAPYPGGLPAGTGREIAYRYGKNDKVTGMDVVEVNPHIDYDSSDLAAQLIWSFLAGLSERKNG